MSVAAETTLPQSSPIPVVQFIAGFGVEQLGGIERYGIELARHLDQSIVRPIVCGLWEWGTAEEQTWRARLEAEGIVTCVGAAKDERSPYRNYGAVIRGLRRGLTMPISILHSHSEFGDLAALWLRRELAAHAVVRTVHNEREWPRRPLRRLLLSHLLYPPTFDLEMGVSRQVVANLDARPLARLLGRRAQVMHNALDFGRFGNLKGDTREKRAALGLGPDGLVVGSVGRLTRQKGYDLLLSAMPAVLRSYPGLQLLIVGEGHEQAALAGQAQSLGLAQAVRFLGRRSDVEALLGVFDLFVSSSRWEGLPTVLLESMAAGLPVVATRVSGTVELVAENVNGLLVPPEDPLALAEGLIRVLDELPRFRMGAEAHRYKIEAEFSMQGLARRHERFYRQLMAR